MREKLTTTDLKLAPYRLVLDHPLLDLSGTPAERPLVFARVGEHDVVALYAGSTVDALEVLGTLRNLKGFLARRDSR